MTENYETAAQAVADAMAAVYENKQANKKNSISGDFSSDNASYPTVKAVKNEFGTKVTSFNSTPSDSNYPSEKLVKSSLDGKANSSHTQASTTVKESSALANIGTSANATQSQVNAAINTVIGTLKSIKAIQVVTTKPTASADTMNKLYIISENSKVNVYYTEQSGTTYTWHKMDTDILDELSIAWSDVTGKPSSFTPASHTHGNLKNDGKVGTAANKPLITGTGGAVSAGSFGSAANTFCQGNDPRLSDARDPYLNELPTNTTNFNSLLEPAFYYVPAQILTSGSLTTVPSITYHSNSDAALFVIGSDEDNTVVKQVFVYEGESYVRYSLYHASVNTWSSWSKELKSSDVQSEISAFATALAGAINP